MDSYFAAVFPYGFKILGLIKFRNEVLTDDIYHLYTFTAENVKIPISYFGLWKWEQATYFAKMVSSAIKGSAILAWLLNYYTTYDNDYSSNVGINNDVYQCEQHPSQNILYQNDGHMAHIQPAGSFCGDLSPHLHGHTQVLSKTKH